MGPINNLKEPLLQCDDASKIPDLQFCFANGTSNATLCQGGNTSTGICIDHDVMVAHVQSYALPKSLSENTDKQTAKVDELEKGEIIEVDPDASVEHNGNEQAATLTVVEATFMVSSWVMNFGIFSMPLVFMRNGLCATSLLVILVAVLCTFTAWLLGDTMAHLRASGVSRPSYIDAAQAAFGTHGTLVVSTICYMEIAVYLVGSSVVLAQNATDLIPWLEFEWIVPASIVVSILLAALPDKAFAYFSLASSSALWLSCIIVLVSGWSLPHWAEGAQLANNPRRLPTSFSMVLFTAATHPLLPSLFENIKSNGDFRKATASAWSIWAFWTILFGAAAYYMFGDALQTIVTANIGRDLDLKPIPALQGLVRCSAVWVVCRMQLGQGALSRPFTQLLARALGLKLPTGNGGLLCMVLSIPILTVVAVAALMLKDSVAALESVSGAILMNLNCFVFPSVLYLRVCDPEKAHKRRGAVAMCAFGVVLTMLMAGLSAD